MRGVAAIAVVIWHAIFMFGWRPASGYLAVDLFFVLSGFVIAHAYDGRLAAGMSVGDFMRRRLIRLWPLYLLGLGVTTAAILASFAIGVQTNWTPGTLAPAVVFSAFYLPTWTGDLSSGFFPLNFPAWSLCLELLINLLFVLTWRRLTVPVLIGVLAVAGLGVIAVSIKFGSLNVGYTWANAIGGVPRVFFGFTAGVLLARLGERLPRITLPAWSLLVMTFGFLAINPGPARMIFDPVASLLISPLLVYLGARTEPGARVLPVFTVLGATSYAVYALHIPAIGVFKVIAEKIFGDHLPVPAIGVAFLVGLLLACWIADAVFDVPVRKTIDRLTAPKTRQPIKAPT
jgi:peptidoglycan/LPS O-acetylase OafA/YrhL